VRLKFKVRVRVRVRDRFIGLGKHEFLILIGPYSESIFRVVMPSSLVNNGGDVLIDAMKSMAKITDGMRPNPMSLTIQS
jgi:hypothetical protein